MVAVSTYIGGSRGSGVLPSAGDVLEMSVVRGVCGVCDMWLGGVGGVVGERMRFGIYQSWGKVGSVFWLRWCWGASWASVWEGGWR